MPNDLSAKSLQHMVPNTHFNICSDITIPGIGRMDESLGEVKYGANKNIAIGQENSKLPQTIDGIEWEITQDWCR